MEALHDLPTIDLVHRIQGGDAAAREALFGRYRERVLAIARVRLSARLRQRLESSDILQEALIEALRGIQRFEMRDESSLIRWLAVLVERRITAQARALRAEKRGPEPELLAHDPPGGAPGPDEVAGAREAGARVQAALAALPDRQREVVLLRDYAGSSWEVVAEELGFVSPDAARMLHARALTRLGAELRSRRERVAGAG
jgi:RNA polymerase sigma-70 factor (ECF subfamily)